MPRKASSVGQKWESGIQQAVPDAKEAYNVKLPQMADAIIEKKAEAITSFTAALNDPNYDSKVRAGLSVGKADVAYGERLDQIAANGLTDSSKMKMVEQTIVRRHLSTHFEAVVASFSADAGDLTTPVGLSKSLQIQIVNTAVMKYIDYFNEGTTFNQIIVVLKANIANIDNLSISA